MRLTSRVGAAITCLVCLFTPQPRVHAQPPASTGPTVHFEPTAGVQTFAVRPPVLRVTPGTTVESRTFSKPGDYYTPEGGPWPGEVGPFYIEGATPGDTLVVRILKVRPNRDSAVSTIGSSLSAVAGDSRLKLLNQP